MKRTRPSSICWNTVSLLGIDVGFSERAKTTGIAIYDRGQLAPPTCIGSLPQDRADALPSDLIFDAIAIDGPIVSGVDTFDTRECEKVLSRGRFSRRCKPAMSHYGYGLPLRKAATIIADEVAPRAKDISANSHLRQSRPGKAIVEAFPNSFLGVLLDDFDYETMGKIRRGRKSDVFYKRVAEKNVFEMLLDLIGWSDDKVLKALHDNASTTTRIAHEHRAALVCLLTAACALSEKATYIGDAAGGHICLPPKELWAPWARATLQDNGKS